MTDTVIALDSSVEDAPNFDGLRVLAVADSADARASIASFLAGYDGVEYELLTQAEFDGHGATVNDEAPSLVLLEAGDEDAANDRIAAVRAGSAYDGVRICLLMKSPSKNAIVRLLKNGADDVLSLTPSDTELSGLLARAAINRVAMREREDRDGRRTIVFIHASGGAGATTLAVNTALKLQKEAERFSGSACLIDLDLQFGDADLQLDLPMRSNLIELLKSPERLDFRMLENLMISSSDKLQVLTAPDEPLPLDAIDRQTIERIISIAHRNHRYVVIDMPAALTSWTDVVLKNADYIFLVTQMNVLALRSARRLIDMLHSENLGNAPIYAIANRYPSKGQGRKISIAEAEKMLRVPVKLKAPNDFGLLINSLDQGLPAVKQEPSSKFVHAIDELLECIAVKEVDEKKGGFVRGLLKRGGVNV